MNTKQVLQIVNESLHSLKNQKFDVITINDPQSPEGYVNLAKIISKLSPIMGNLIEFHTVDFLNQNKQIAPYGKWIRQDPDFPDATFKGTITPEPGIEIKAWFPLATEMTARFRESQTRFPNNEIYVAILAWVPEFLVFGTPKIVDVELFSALSLAQARDNHYHNPPDYVVLEPNDTKERTRNLQQSITYGYKWQEKEERRKAEAKNVVESWGNKAFSYSVSPQYQQKLLDLIAKYSYRIDTNFAKIDRIQHQGVEEFKSRVLSSSLFDLTLQEWNKLFNATSFNSLVEEITRIKTMFAPR